MAQAIPDYTMSCFKLPKNICKDIDNICARFWWGSSTSKKKIHWKSWKSLCKSKDLGGLGFRDFLHFNQAMLAKMRWRIIKNPTSLIAKTLKGRYFKDRPFLEAQLWSNPSLTWKRIVWGRNLFLKGYIWKVGNGHYIEINKDPWLNRDCSKTPTLTNDSLKGRKVKSLIDESHRCSEDMVRANFHSHDANVILNIPLGDENARDEIIWSPDKQGKFSVKSAYHLALEATGEAEASSSCKNKIKKSWKSLWNIQTIPRAKSCVWKILNDIVPTRSNLIKKRPWY